MAKRTRSRKGDSNAAVPPPEETDAAPPTEDLDLPWLTAVEEEEDGPSRRTARWGYGAAGIVLVLVAGLFVLVTVLTQRAGPEADTRSPETSATQVAAREAPAERKAAPPPAPVRPKAAPPAARGDASVPVVQLASFYSKDRATRYWQQLERRHKDLGRLDHRIVEGSFQGRTVHRLRASGARATEVCEKLRRSGVACLPIGANSPFATAV
jgi:hypothetical protein